jgi:TldD protein
MDQTLMEKILNKAGDIGCKYAEVRYQQKDVEVIQVDNRVLRSYSANQFSGVGIRVVYGGSIGFSSTSNLNENSLLQSLEVAVSGARAQLSAEEEPFCPVDFVKADIGIYVKKDPLDYSPEEKIQLVRETNEAAYTDEAIKSSRTRYGFVDNYSHFLNDDGVEIKIRTPIIGIAQICIAQHSTVKESVSDQISKCSGWEFIEKMDWNTLSRDLSNLAIEAAKSKTAPSGSFPVIIDQDIIGIVLHEALGHACEGDAIANDISVLSGRIGEIIAGDQVTIYDEGIVEDGYYHPFDDEGVEKQRTVIVEDGILKGFITDRRNAKKLDIPVTGNGRIQDFENSPIVRQTNFYMKAGKYNLDELFEDMDYGIHIRGRGGKGGQVDPGMGTFTFGVGPSKIIRNGEPMETVRGVVISGSILETLKTIDAVGNESKVKTSVFGGCGKAGQAVKVGYGGPPVRALKMTVGGRN